MTFGGGDAFIGTHVRDPARSLLPDATEAGVMADPAIFPAGTGQV
jgi:hypothetical protein